MVTLPLVLLSRPRLWRLALLALLLVPSWEQAQAKPPASHLPASHLLVESRTLHLLEAGQSEEAPPLLRLGADGTPLTLFFADAQLDPRAAVQLVSRPSKIELRVAEHAVYLIARPKVRTGLEATLTLTLSSGRPLGFRIRVVGSGEARDGNIEMKLPEAERARSCARSLESALARGEACERQVATAGTDHLLKLLGQQPASGPPLRLRHIGWRDKQHLIYVELLDEVDVGATVFLRVRIENRDPSGIAWRPGELMIRTEDPVDPRRLSVRSHRSRGSIASGESMMLLAAFEKIPLPKGVGLRLVIPEAKGLRHLQINHF